MKVPCKACEGTGINMHFSREPECEACEGTGSVNTRSFEEVLNALYMKQRYLTCMMSVTKFCDTIRLSTSDENGDIVTFRVKDNTVELE